MPEKSKLGTRIIKFRCDNVFVFANGKVCHTVRDFYRFAHNVNDFLFLIHRNIEETLKKKVLWKDIIVKNIETCENGAWKKFLYGEHSLSEIKYKTPQ